jgi:ribosomal protein S21
MNNRSNGKRRVKKSYDERVIGTIVPGTPLGVNVVDGDLKFALRELKKVVRGVGYQPQLKKKRHFESKSDANRKMRDYAIFLNKKRTDDANRYKQR